MGTGDDNRGDENLDHEVANIPVANDMPNTAAGPGPGTRPGPREPQAAVETSNNVQQARLINNNHQDNSVWNRHNLLLKSVSSSSFNT